MLDNMWKVKIDTLDVGVFGGLKDFLDDNGGVVDHGLVEYLIEPEVLARVLKCVHSVCPVKWNASFHNRCF
ncbi:hypothetical protein U1Q18_019070 [Sarracenia purpurea var. burkii]